MTDTKATPRPWEVGKLDSEGVPIYSGPTEDAEVIAYVHDVQSGDTKANAALIVEAVNAYDAMRDALRLAIRGLDTDGSASAAATLNVQGRAALAAAEGKVDG